MRSFAEIEAAIARVRAGSEPSPERAQALLGLAEEALEHWLLARGETPTDERREGFRLLALHRQGARGVPSFNACRETCREVAYHYNLVQLEPAAVEAPRRAELMAMLVLHLALFVAGKLQQSGLGEFCCSARPLHAQAG
jgi:hypothetical protein